VQKLLEASRDSQNVLTIRSYEESQAEAFDKLRKDYAESRGHDEFKTLLRTSFSSKEERYSLMRFLAFSLGEPVGFIEGIAIPEKKAERQPPTAPASGEPSASASLKPEPADLRRDEGNTIEVTHLHVRDYMRNTGVSRRLIRRIVEEANDTCKKAVWLKTVSPVGDAFEKFHKCGFVPAEQGRLYWYDLMLAVPELREVRPWSR
jgi:predicted GNAT family acetyltransferase